MPDCAALDAGAEEAVSGDSAPGRFERAWAKFGETCFQTVAPEATYQAWFAHFLMEEFDVLQVVREVDFGARYLDQEARDRMLKKLKRRDLMRMAMEEGWEWVTSTASPRMS